MAAELVTEWNALQPPVITGAPTAEQQAAMKELAGKKKAWLKVQCEKLGKSEKALVKELTKAARKAAPKTAKPAGPAAPPAPAAKAASPGAADGTAKIQQEFFDCAMHGRYQEMRRLAKHAAVDVNSIKIQGKAPLGIMCFRGDAAEIEFLLDQGANRVGPEMLPDGKETGDLAADMARVVATGVEKGRCSAAGKKAALATIASKVPKVH